MSLEAWGTPPDPEPQRCPECGEESHVEGCELGKMQARAVKAEELAAELLSVLNEAMAWAMTADPQKAAAAMQRALAAVNKTSRCPT